uniref:Uncharacterized protein n=1 Tax=Manihot esculenta TaxID=3983 RepID=A0A2C9WKQ5_MANES
MSFSNFCFVSWLASSSVPLKPNVCKRRMENECLFPRV